MPLHLDPTLNLELKIWRYMDLAKFVCLLTGSSLYFADLQTLAADDPFEGLVPRAQAQADLDASLIKADVHIEKAIADSRERLRTMTEDDPERALLKAFIDEPQMLRQIISEKLKLSEMRSMYAVNCWHANTVESEAMWKLYTAMGSGVAIESTVERLQAALLASLPAVDIYVGKVKYADFESQDVLNERHTAVLTKRKSYEHEREVRAFIPSHVGSSGRLVPVDLRKLIKAVHISPSANAVFEMAVRQLCSKLEKGSGLEVRRSALMQAPDY